MIKVEIVEKYRLLLETNLNRLIADLEGLSIGKSGQYPFGWRKAAKGRTVWRLLEELITQNLEKNQTRYGLHTMSPSGSEVSVYDFTCKLTGSDDDIYVNIKGANVSGDASKDDISKANELVKFYAQNPDRNLFIATFLIEFKNDMFVKLVRCIVMPITWIPDVYVNPSNNGNLQSSKYKDIAKAVKRTNSEFLSVFSEAHKLALVKKAKNNTQ